MAFTWLNSVVEMAVQQTLIHVASSKLKLHIFIVVNIPASMSSVYLCYPLPPLFPIPILLSFHEDNLLQSLGNVSSYLPFDTL
jgi:hypothetical protein